MGKAFGILATLVILAIGIRYSMPADEFAFYLSLIGM
jgi:hypothetical protein